MRDHAEDRVVATGVRADGARIALGEVAAHRAESNFLADLEDGLGKLARVRLGGAEDVKREARGRLLPDAGQTSEAEDQALDGVGRQAITVRSDERRHAGQGDAARHLGHLVLLELLGLGQRLAHGRDDEVLQHADIFRVDNGGIDLQRDELELTRDHRGDHPAAGRGVDPPERQIGLRLLKTRLHLLRGLHEVPDIGHLEISHRP